MKLHSLRGMQDILPPEVYVWQFVEETAREIFERHGYKEIRTPILEDTALFQQSIGEGTDIVNKEMYTFMDKAARSVTLRPEGTAPIVRAYIENHMSSADYLKLYYIGPMFRSERPQKGRSRQFHQLGVEAIGSKHAYVDAGLIRLLARFFKEIGLSGYKIKLSSLGCGKDKQKFAKELRVYLSPEKARLCEDCRIRLERNVLRTLDCKLDSCKAVLKNSPKAIDFLCSDCRMHYEKVKNLLTQHSPINFVEDANMVRGLDYYTKTVFEVTHPALGAQDAIAAGGRYDNLVEDFGGRETPAVGFAIGIERLIMALPSKKKEEEKRKKEKRLQLYLATTGNLIYDEAEKAVEPLREEGIFCEINYDPDKSLKSQMNQANKKNAMYVAIFGDEEFKRGEVILRNMDTSEQRDVKLDELAKEVKKGISRFHVQKNS